MPSSISQFDAEVAKRIDNTKLAGFGAPQAGMVRRVMFKILAEQLHVNPTMTIEQILHMVKLEHDRDA